MTFGSVLMMDVGEQKRKTLGEKMEEGDSAVPQESLKHFAT